MGLLKIDESKCRQDGICVSECPTAVIRINDASGYPEMVPGGEQMCLLCGHCVAVCPHAALDHSQVPIAQCPLIKKALALNAAQANQFLRSRRSVRHFKEKPVSKETIQKLIETARYAPTGSNSQLLEWQVVADRKRIKGIAGTEKRT